MKRICVACQKAINARREAQLDAATSSKPSNKEGALLGRNPQGRRGSRRWLENCPTSLLASRPASETGAVALFVALCSRL